MKNRFVNYKVRKLQNQNEISVQNETFKFQNEPL